MATTKTKVSTKKKTTKKKAAAPRTKKRQPAPEFDPGTTIVKTESTKVPKLEVRQAIVGHVAKSKGKGVKGSTLLAWTMKDQGLAEKRAILHILGSVKIGFIAPEQNSPSRTQRSPAIASGFSLSALIESGHSISDYSE